MADTIEISVTDVREMFRKIVSGKSSGQVACDALRASWQSMPDFYGDTPEGMTDKLDKGYAPDGEFNGYANGSADQIRAELVRDDEMGDLDLQSIISGEDSYRIMYEEVPSPRSVTITAQVNMLGDVPVKILTEYTDFILRAIMAAETMGAAPGLEILHLVRGVFTKSDSEHLTLTIPLVNQGEAMDPTSWRAFLSPGGFRMLGFVARGIAANKLNKKVRYGFGRSAGPGWDVKRDGDHITITCPPSAYDFPREEMEAKLVAAFA